MTSIKSSKSQIVVNNIIVHSLAYNYFKKNYMRKTRKNYTKAYS